MWQFDAVSKILKNILAVKQLLEKSVLGPSEEDHKSLLLAVVRALEDIADDMEMVAGVSRI